MPTVSWVKSLRRGGELRRTYRAWSIPQDIRNRYGIEDGNSLQVTIHLSPNPITGEFGVSSGGELQIDRVTAQEIERYSQNNAEVTFSFTTEDASEIDDALDDLDSDRPTQVAFFGMRYRRDPAVRSIVRQRAKGKCELCGETGFRQPDGSHYLECHHIIALAHEGEDRVSNVIALCPKHHREAHFGEQASELEQQLIQVLNQLG